MFNQKSQFFIGCLLLSILHVLSCGNVSEQRSTRKPIDYIREIPGVSDSMPAEIAEKGKVLIAYSDCYTCHKEEERSVGPAFKDIAKRYPANKVFIEMLSNKVINGGSRSWGYPVMDPHPTLSFDDAKMMVTYILSKKQEIKNDYRK